MRVPIRFEVLWSRSASPSRIPVEFRGQVSQVSLAETVSNEHLVVLFDDDVLLGSGVLVRLNDGTMAVLTARHVVIDLAVAGSFHCVVPQWGWTSFEPRFLRVHPSSDVALVGVPDGPTAGIAWADWNPATLPPSSLAGQVLATGTPGAWKGRVDLPSRQIHGLRALGAWCDVDPNPPVMRRSTLNICATNDLPESVGGMSGGPVLAPSGRVVGVITHESLSGPRRLYAAPLDQVLSLVTPFQPEPDAPQDFMREVGTLIAPLRYTNPHRFPHAPFHMIGVFEHFWSASDPEYRISRLIAIACATTRTSRRFVMNTESVFPSNRDTLEGQIQDCMLEFDLMLKTPDVEVLESGPRPSKETEELAHELLQRIAPNARVTVVRPEEESD